MERSQDLAGQGQGRLRPPTTRAEPRAVADLPRPHSPQDGVGSHQAVVPLGNGGCGAVVMVTGARSWLSGGAAARMLDALWCILARGGPCAWDRPRRGTPHRQSLLP